MPQKLDCKSWATAVKNHPGARTSGRTFTSQIQQRKTSQIQSLSSDSWKKRVEQSRQAPGGGRHRALVKPEGKRKGRQVGGMLRSTIPRSRKEITEKERQALPKTGDQVAKKGINSEKWAYDHRKATANRRNTALSASNTPKKGINSEKWHYDHQKAKAARGPSKAGPTTHTSAEKKRTQAEAIRQHQPKQPTRPQQPQRPPPAKAPTPRRK